MFRISKFSIAFFMALSHPVFASSSSQPPRALFGYAKTYSDAGTQKYGIACSNAAIVIDEAIASIEYKNSKADKPFTSSPYTPDNEDAVVTCNTDKNYYESSTSKESFTIHCNNGVWQNTSLCIRKCKFTKDEFKVDSIVKGRDTSQESSAAQFTVVGFDTATSLSKYNTIQKIGTSYYVPVGDSVRITCPSTHPPFTSDSSSAAQFINLDTNSFVTTCAPSGEKGRNKWSNYAACYNGYKPCNNAEITVKVEGQDIYTDDGEHFKEFGGEKTSPEGRTLHGARLQLACNKYPWYKRHDYVSPTCRDGRWTSTDAYCKAYSCTVNEIFSGASNVQNNIPAHSFSAIDDDRNKKLYYNQTHIFRCKYNNRIGGREGKAFKCVWDSNDMMQVKDMKQFASNWYDRYCTTNCYSELPGFYSFFGSGETITNVNAEGETYVIDEYDRWAWRECPEGYNTYCRDATCSRRACILFGYRTTQYEEYDHYDEWAWQSCNDGYYDWHCRDATCSRRTCYKKRVKCNYKTTDYSCNSNGLVSDSSSWENIYFPGWDRTCIESGLTGISLLDQEYKSVDKSTKQRIQCGSNGCAIVNVQ